MSRMKALVHVPLLFFRDSGIFPEKVPMIPAWAPRQGVLIGVLQSADTNPLISQKKKKKKMLKSESSNYFAVTLHTILF